MSADYLYWTNAATTSSREQFSNTCRAFQNVSFTRDGDGDMEASTAAYPVALRCLVDVLCVDSWIYQSIRDECIGQGCTPQDEVKASSSWQQRRQLILTTAKTFLLSSRLARH
eukprot:scaffold517_cov255-Pinguiococcus_pyrenoidosus.AAC.11